MDVATGSAVPSGMGKTPGQPHQNHPPTLEGWVSWPSRSSHQADLSGSLPGQSWWPILATRSFARPSRSRRGTRPLALAVTSEETVYWGEYFANPRRDEVNIYGSDDHGDTWSVVHTFSEALRQTRAQGDLGPVRQVSLGAYGRLR